MPPAAIVVLFWLLLLGLASTVIGGRDAVAGDEIGVRLVGSLVFAAGVVLLVGSAALRRREPIGLTVAILGALVGVVIGVMAFLTQVANDQPDRRMVLWVLIIALSAGAARYVRALMPWAERTRSMWNRLPILKSAVSLGVLASLAQFWYSSIYLPTTAPATVNLESRIDKLTTRGNHLVVRGSITIRNTSDIRLNVLASTRDVIGDRLMVDRASPQLFKRLIQRVEQGRYMQVDRYTRAEGESRVVHGRLLAGGTFLEPREIITVPILTWVPKDRYNILYLRSSIAFARGKVLAVQDETSEIATSRRTGKVVELTRVPPDGWLQSLTRGDRYVRVEYGAEPHDTTPQVWIAPDRDPDPPAGFDKRLRRFYGVAATSSEALTSLP
jgi:hypothetical protein